MKAQRTQRPPRASQLLLALAQLVLLAATARAASLPAPAARASIGGVCRGDSECNGSLICASVSDGVLEPCAGRFCACAPQLNNVVACARGESCPNSDVCVRVAFGVGVCTPCAVLGSDDPDLLGSRRCDGSSGGPIDDNGVCVDARLLRGVADADADAAAAAAANPTHTLVFATDRLARVLCDSHGSCATPAHLVTLHGHPMSMRAYCARHADPPCSRHTLRVNSPAMRRGVRVATPTDGLLFTALSARFGTRTEEVVLGALVRAGF